MFAAMTLLLSSCFSNGLGGYGTTTSSNSTSGVLGNVLGSVLGNILLGGMGFDQSSLLGNWNYSAPGAAFTSEQTLNKAGGAGAASALVSSLASNYNAIGINSNNTMFSFLEGNKFAAKVNGIPFDGTYAYNQQTGEIALKTAAQTIKGNVIKTTNGMGLMFDAGQMTSMLQKAGKVSNEAAVKAVSQLCKSKDGARVGFELTR